MHLSPFKIILGNFIEALQMGADTIVMVGSGPPCRLGLYDLVQKVILEDMGLHYRWLTIPPRLTWHAIWKNYEETKELKKELSWKNIVLFPYGLWMGWKKMMACEELERLAMRVRPQRSEERGDPEEVEEGPFLGGRSQNLTDSRGSSSKGSELSERNRTGSFPNFF